MATIIGTLKALLSASSDEFVSALGDAETAMDGLGTKFSAAGKAASLLSAPVLAAGAGISLAVGSALTLGDSLTRMSQISGLSTEKLQELKFIGGQTGTSLESMTMASAILAKNLAASGDATDKTTKIMSLLSVPIRDSTGALRDQGVLFTETIGALAGMQNKTLQAALAQELLGRGGKELIPVLAEGSRGIAAMQTQAHQLGLVLDEKTIKALDKTGDQVQAVKDAFGAAGNRIGVAFLPLLDRLVPILTTQVIPAMTTMVGWITRLVEWFSKLPGPLQVVIGGVIGLAAAAGPVLLGLGLLVGQIPALVAGWGLLSGKAGLLITKLTGSSTAAGTAGSALTKVVGPLGAVTLGVTLGTTAWTLWGDSINKLTDNALPKMGEWLGKKLPGLFTFLGDTFGSTTQMVRTNGTLLTASVAANSVEMKTNLVGVGHAATSMANEDALATALMAQNAEKKKQDVSGFVSHYVAGYGAMLQALTLHAAASMKASDTQGLSLIALADQTTLSTQGVQFDMGKMYDFASTVMTGIGTAAESMATGLVQSMAAGGAGMKQVVGNFLTTVINMMISAAIVSLKIASLISHAMKWAWTPWGFVVIGGLFAALLAIRAAFFGKAAKMAEGGIVMRPTLALIGEAGPEAVVPLRRGGRGGGGMLAGAGGLSLTVNIYGSVGVEDIGAQLVRTLRLKGILS